MNIVEKMDEFTKKWFQDVDKLIRDNIDEIKCKDIRRIYFDLFRELKKWRSNSSGFTGYSEFLLFRCLLHSIKEPFTALETGNINSYPIIFKSTKYEISQGTRQEFNGVRNYPDISVKYNNKLISIAQIKISMAGGLKQLESEITKFSNMKQANPDLKGLFISYSKGAFGSKKQLELRKSGYQTVTLEDNEGKIKEALEYLI